MVTFDWLACHLFYIRGILTLIFNITAIGTARLKKKIGKLYLLLTDNMLTIT